MLSDSAVTWWTIQVTASWPRADAAGMVVALSLLAGITRTGHLRDSAVKAFDTNVSKTVTRASLLCDY